MKRIKFIVAAMIFFACSNTNVYAVENTSDTSKVYYSIDADDETLENATLVSQKSYIENDRQITETVYVLPDGTEITDTLDISAIAPASSSGTDTATRSRKVSNWGTIKITASFKWYTSGHFSYVKCTSMTASRSLNSKVAVKKWDKDYTKDYVKIGKAKAQVTYHFYQTNMPTQFTKGTFKITCSDSGTISDNG